MGKRGGLPYGQRREPKPPREPTRPCDCEHVGHCLFRAGLKLVDRETGRKVYRPATNDEKERAKVDPKTIPLGALVGRGLAPGDVQLLGIVDGDAEYTRKVADRGRELVGSRCRADSVWWRLTHTGGESDG